jgi:hypothetical protein
VFDEQVQKLLEADGVVVDTGPGGELAVGVDQGDVVVVAGSVDSAEHPHGLVSRPSCPRRVLLLVTAVRRHAAPYGRALSACHPISRS